MDGLAYFRETAATYFSNISFNWKDIRVRGLRSSSIEFGRQCGPCAGGFHYRDSALLSSTCRNRVILWRYYDLKLELLEVSLDISLACNALRLDMADAGPLVPEVCVQELGQNHVVVMFATATTVHRLVLPHPEAVLKDPAMLSVGEGVQPSILAFASQEGGVAEFSMVSIFPSTVLPIPVTSCGAWAPEAGPTTFALASPQGAIYIVQLPRSNAPPARFELRETSIVKKIWSYVPTIRSTGFVEECPVSVSVHSFAGETVVMALCRDLKLRLWSCQQKECLMVHNLMEHISMATEEKLSDKEVNCLVLKKAPDGISTSLRFGIHLLTTSRTQILMLQLILVQNKLILNHLAEFSGPSNYSMVDFQPTNCEVWSVWTDSTGAADNLVLHAVYEGDHSCSWQRVPLLPDPSPDVLVPPYKELMEAYLDEIFKPGGFSGLVIFKALELMGGPLPKGTQSWEDLKRETILRVQEEVVRSATSNELRSDEYRNLQLTCWDKFYSHCLQYHKEITRPLGVFQDPSTGTVCLIKKDCFSFAIAEDSIGSLIALWKDMAPLSERVQDEDLATDLSLFLECVRLLGQELDASTLDSFLEDLNQPAEAGVLAQELAEAVTSEKIPSSDVFLLTLKDKLHHVSDLEAVLEYLGKALDVSCTEIRGATSDEAPGPEMQLAVSQLLGGHSATLILTACLVETSHSRLLLCRDILILLSFVVQEKMVQCTTLQEYISSRKANVSTFADLVHNYHTLHWMLTRSVVQAPNSAFEFSLKQFASLEISGMPISHNRLAASSSSMLGELYLIAEGGMEVRASLLEQRLFPPNTSLHPSWLHTLPRMLSLALRQLWPSSSSVKLCEFMLSNCQYLHLQEYCTRMEHIHAEYPASRKFLLGQCLVSTGELSKGLSCFVQASLCLTEPLLQSIIGETVEGETRDDPLMLYYVKVMKLFEQVSAPDMVINVATEAAKLGDRDCPSTAVVWSTLFKYHLELGHFSAAYEAMVNNPDPSRRKDCVQRFVVVLTEQKAVKELCQFPYTGLEDEVERVMENRARSVDLTKHNYYDLLYCFYTSRGNYRKAASVMYEHGVRLGREVPKPTSLQKQANCLVIAMAALSLTDKRYAWIVRPAKLDEHGGKDQPGSSEKHTKRRREEKRTKQPVEVLTLPDLEKEYLLVKAKLNILQREPSMSTQLCSPYVSAGEVVSLLVQAGFFDMAIQVSQGFKLPLSHVFEALTARCVYLSHSIATFRKGNSDATTWDWLGLNNTSDITYARETTLADQAWALLKKYLEIHDPPHNYQLQKCVARKLLLLGHPLVAQGDSDNALITALPQWLVDNYKRTNPAELLRLFITFDLLEPATAVAMEYIDAVLVDGRAAFFGVKDTLHATNPPVWLPHNTFDVLLQALHDAQSRLPTLCGAFESKLKDYFEKVANVSDTMRMPSSRGLVRIESEHEAAMDYM